MRTIQHGLSDDLLGVAREPKGDYLAFLGRISPEKRPDRAIAIARSAGIELKIAAKVDAVDRAYFADVIEPLLGQPGVEFIGEINDREKQAFLGNAPALLFPIDWPEPFGLVMIEAMACGTPVIAWRCGAVPEVVDDGLTGFIVTSQDQAARAVESAAGLDRSAIRHVFERRFSSKVMARNYLALYWSLDPRVRFGPAARSVRVARRCGYPQSLLRPRTSHLRPVRRRPPTQANHGCHFTCSC